MKRLIGVAMAGAFAALLAACAPPAEKAPQQSAVAPAPIQPAATQAPGGAYKIDLAHTSILFRVRHLGLSNYTGRFTKADAQLNFDPAHPENSTIAATIDARSLQTDYPEPKKLNFDAQIQGAQWLDAPHFPEMTFKSTKVILTGANTADIAGDFTMRGQTHPLVLHATFNGGYPAGGMDPSGARIGFSARGALKRSAYGMSFGIPAPGTDMGVSDEVELIIETEFSQAAPKR